MTELLGTWRWETEFGTAQSVSKPKHEKAVLKLLEHDKILLDTETDGLGNHRRMRLLQVGWKDEAWLLDPGQHQALIREIANSSVTFIAHNAPFDLMTIGLWLGDHDLEVAYHYAQQKALCGEVIDTMATEQMRSSEQRVKSLSRLAGEQGVHNFYEDQFNDEAARLGISEEDKYADIPLNSPYYLRYSAHDIWQLQAAYQANKKHHLKKSVQTEVIVRVLYEELSSRGMILDYPKADALHSRMKERQTKVLKRLAKVEIEKVGSAAQIASALEEAGAVLTARTPTGKPQVNKDVLNSLIEGMSGPAKKIAKDVITARSLTNDIGRIENLVRNSYPEEGENYGVVHPNLWSIGALTSRSSCREPNLHQLDKHTGEPEVRGLIWAGPGRIMASVDFNTIEVRVLADLSKDQKLIDRMLEGADVHGELAAEVGIPRQAAKVGNFAMLYGASQTSIARQTGMDVEQAVGLKQAWSDLYPQAAQAMENWTEDAYDTGRTVLPNGWSPKIAIGDFGSILAYRAINYQIQGWAAVVFKIAGIQLARAKLWHLTRMVVHDEFAVSLPKDQAQELLGAIMHAATVTTKRMIYTTGGELYGSHWGIKDD